MTLLPTTGPINTGHEMERLKELRSFEILDTPAETEFDSLTALASDLFNSPVALITLIDQNRQFIKAKIGTEIPETSREDSICQFTILQDDVLVIPDTAQSPEVRSNSLVKKAGVRFYAGAPLITKSGYRVGTVCILDYVPRTWNEQQRKMLRILSNQVIALLERHRYQRTQAKRPGISESSAESLPFGLISEDEDQNVLFANQAVKKILELAHINNRYGHTSKTFSHLFADSEGFQKKSMELVLKRAPFLAEILDTQTGKVLERDYIPIIEHGKYKGQIWLYRDISEKPASDKIIHQQRKQIAESSRLAALGEMAGEVAHEINNPLAIIRAKISMMRHETEEGVMNSESLIAHLSKVEDVLIRISKIVAGLSSYAREDQATDQPSCVLIRDLVENTVSFCREKFEVNAVRLKIDVCDEALKMTCFPVQISQVLLNLLNNAFDSVMEAVTAEKQVNLYASAQEGQIVFIVSDNGLGVSEKVRDRLFNPFFTTKPPGKGTGLGLSISKTIVELHKGTIELDRENKVGARFLVRLPGHEV